MIDLRESIVEKNYLEPFKIREWISVTLFAT